jgi:hypothetical protein
MTNEKVLKLIKVTCLYLKHINFRKILDFIGYKWKNNKIRRRE